MDKIILKDGTKFEFKKIDGLSITFTDKTVEELEKILTKENCRKVELSTENREVYGIYNNLECTSITKNIEDSTVTVRLKELDDTIIRIESLEGAINDLGNIISGMEEK